MTLTRALSTSLFIATLALPMTTTAAFADGADTLEGKSVFIKMHTQHTPINATTGMDGKVKSADDAGLLIDAVTNDSWKKKTDNPTGGYQNNNTYNATVFIPWSSISYVKIK